MSEHAVPEDLREEYESAKWRVADHGSPVDQRKMQLIERIAKIESERDALKEQMRYHEINLDERTQLCESDGIPPSDCCAPTYCALAPYKEITRLRAALARMQGPLTDEEWLELCAGTPIKSVHVECFMSRRELDALLAARAAGEHETPIQFALRMRDETAAGNK